MKKRKLLLIATFMSIATCTFSQPTNPGGDVDNPVPIAGLEFLIAGGALLGILKIIKHNKDSHQHPL